VIGLTAFLCGFLIPAVAGRVMKVWYFDAGTALARMVYLPKITVKKRSLKVIFYRLVFSCLWGLAAVGFVRVAAVPSAFGIAFFCMLGVLLVVDSRIEILPDMITLPLLILGFLFGAVVRGAPLDSAYGAILGYCIPLLSSFVVYPFRKEAMGGGDIKMMAACGAWLGAAGLLIMVFLSLFVFAAQAIALRKRQFAYGPAISLSALITLAFQESPLFGLISSYLL